VFTDVMLPGEMDGFDLAAWIRDNYPDVQVMLTSGNGPKIDAARELGSNDSLLVKPYAFHTVARHFMDLMDSRDRAN